jgi:hypothetical protein
MGKHRIDRYNDQMWDAATLAVASDRLPRHSSVDEDATSPLSGVDGDDSAPTAAVD